MASTHQDRGGNDRVPMRPGALQLKNGCSIPLAGPSRTWNKRLVLGNMASSAIPLGYASGGPGSRLWRAFLARLTSQRTQSAPTAAVQGTTMESGMADTSG